MRLREPHAAPRVSPGDRPAEEVRIMILDLPQWTSLLLVLIAVPALALAALELVHALLDRLMQARGAPVLKRVLQDGRVAVRVTVALFAAVAVLPAADLPGATTAWLDRILGLLLAGALGWALTRKTGALFDAYIDLSRSGGENDLLMRRRRTQLVVFRRFAVSAGLLLTLGLVLTAIPPVRAIGLSLFASAGVAGIVAGIAARPAVSNLIAGLQLAVTQPIRIGDAVLVEGAWGHVEEIGSTFVTVTTWDQRSLIVPLTYFLEKPISNWTRNSTRLLDTVFIYLDYGVPVEALRAQAKEILKSTPLWDCRVFAVQVTELRERSMEVRILMSAANAGDMFDLRCLVRERLVEWLAREHPQALARDRVELSWAHRDGAEGGVRAAA
jgi:small-conductance mechanosensitive channel